MMLHLLRSFIHMLGFYGKVCHFSLVQERPWMRSMDTVLILYTCVPLCTNDDIYMSVLHKTFRVCDWSHWLRMVLLGPVPRKKWSRIGLESLFLDQMISCDLIPFLETESGLYQVYFVSDFPIGWVPTTPHTPLNAFGRDRFRKF